MIHKAYVKVNRKKETTLSDEDYFRRLAVKIIEGMSFNELVGIFNFSKIDPESDLYKKGLIYLFSEGLLKEVEKLREDGKIMYKAQISI